LSDVYVTGARTTGTIDNYFNKIYHLLSVPEFAELIPGGRKTTFIKSNYSQVGYMRHVRPVMIRALVEKVREMGGNPVVTDTSGYFPKGGFTGHQWFTAAEIMGYSELALGCERILANGYEGDDGEFFSTGGEELGGVEVARAIREADCLIMVSHVTAHPLAGISGALVNLGVESLNNSGKTRVHQGLKPLVSPEKCSYCGGCDDQCQWGAISLEGRTISVNLDLCGGCGTCVALCPTGVARFETDQKKMFQRRVAEASAALVKTLKKKIIFVNLLTDIVPQPDRLAWADVPFVPDLGFLASLDPVAIDALTVEMVRLAPGIPRSAAEDFGALEQGKEKFGPITGSDPEYMLEYAQKMGVGSREYQVLISRR
jgi:uncharacterized Fe-S center protein